MSRGRRSVFERLFDSRGRRPQAPGRGPYPAGGDPPGRQGTVPRAGLRPDHDPPDRRPGRHFGAGALPLLQGQGSADAGAVRSDLRASDRGHQRDRKDRRRSAGARAPLRRGLCALRPRHIPTNTGWSSWAPTFPNRSARSAIARRPTIRRGRASAARWSSAAWWRSCPSSRRRASSSTTRRTPAPNSAGWASTAWSRP